MTINPGFTSTGGSWVDLGNGMGKANVSNSEIEIELLFR